MIWTADCQEALDKMSKERDRTVMSQTNKIFATMMADLVQCCLSDLGTCLNRTKYETLVTIHVHQVNLAILLTAFCLKANKKPAISKEHTLLLFL